MLAKSTIHKIYTITSLASSTFKSSTHSVTYTSCGMEPDAMLPRATAKDAVLFLDNASFLPEFKCCFVTLPQCCGLYCQISVCFPRVSLSLAQNHAGLTSVALEYVLVIGRASIPHHIPWAAILQKHISRGEGLFSLSVIVTLVNLGQLAL